MYSKRNWRCLVDNNTVTKYKQIIKWVEDNPQIFQTIISWDKVSHNYYHKLANIPTNIIKSKPKPLESYM